VFTGIIQELGQIINLKKSQQNLEIRIFAEKILLNKKIGDSIAINGACQTITKINKNYFQVIAIPETLRCTNFQNFQKDDLVNLEAPLKIGDSLDGHFVLGHVDSTAKCHSCRHLCHPRKDRNLNFKNTEPILEIEIPKSIAKYIVHKGSITVNGVSLTISKIKEKTFEISLIPHTLKNTNLGKLKKGDLVNLEVDVIARYVVNHACFGS